MKSYSLTFLLSLLILPVWTQAQSLQEGKKALERFEFDQAKSIFTHLMQADPTNASYNYYLGYIYVQNEMRDSALYYFHKGIAAEDALSYVGEGRVKLLHKDFTGAQSDFDKAVSLTKGQDAFVMQQIADAYVKAQNQKDAAYALKMINNAIQLDPKNPQYQVTLADVDRLLGESGKGMTLYEAIGGQYHYPLAYLKAGELMAKVKNMDAATKYYNKVIALDSTYPPVYKDLGELYFSIGQVDKAIANYKHYLDEVGYSPYQRLRYAGFLYINKQYIQSLAELQKIEAQLPDNIVLLRLMAYDYNETGNNAKAQQYMNKYMQNTKPVDRVSLDELYDGRILSKNGEDSLAIIHLKKALQLDSANLAIYTDLATAYSNRKEYDSAAQVLQKKVNKSGSKLNTQDIYYLGVDYYLAKNYKMADTTFGTLIHYLPDYLTSYLYRARANAFLDPESTQGLAKPYYEAFISKAAPQSATYKDQLIEAYSYLGYYYYKAKKMTQAKENYDKVLLLDPHNKTALNFFKILKAAKNTDK